MTGGDAASFFQRKFFRRITSETVLAFFSECDIL